MVRPSTFHSENPPWHATRNRNANLIPAGFDRPSARVVSNAIAALEENISNERYLTDILWLWGQLVDHDIDLTENAVDEFGNPLELLPT